MCVWAISPYHYVNMEVHMYSKAQLTKLKKDQLIDLVMALESEVEEFKTRGFKLRPQVKTAPLPEKPKGGVHCIHPKCTEVTDVRGFFCCGQHDCDHNK